LHAFTCTVDVNCMHAVTVPAVGVVWAVASVTTWVTGTGVDGTVIAAPVVVADAQVTITMSVSSTAETVVWSTSTATITCAIAHAVIGLATISLPASITSTSAIRLTRGVVDALCAVIEFRSVTSMTQGVAASGVLGTADSAKSSGASTASWEAAWSDGVRYASVTLIGTRAEATLTGRVAATLVLLAVDASVGFVADTLTIVVTMGMSDA